MDPRRPRTPAHRPAAHVPRPAGTGEGGGGPQPRRVRRGPRARQDLDDGRRHAPGRGPSFAGGAVGRLLQLTADRYGLRLLWHTGFQLHADEVPADFRGPDMPALAREVARHFATESDVRVVAEPQHQQRRRSRHGGRIDVAAVGRAAVAAHRDPHRLQRLKHLWHILVRYGSPYES